jgi:hypothetical protein
MFYRGWETAPTNAFVDVGMALFAICHLLCAAPVAHESYLKRGLLRFQPKPLRNCSLIAATGTDSADNNPP